jgi:NAD(P)-dependent dehydrogenase (short-subunit alcohol dehydrogenase family)
LAFGAASRGAKVLIANRNKARAEALAAAVPGGATVVSWEDLQSGAVSADVLANSTSVGMVPNVEDTPVATAAVGKVRAGRGLPWLVCLFQLPLLGTHRGLALLAAHHMMHIPRLLYC